jgi:hypothetical protein
VRDEAGKLALPETVKDKDLLFRLDSGNDSIQTLEALLGKDEKEAKETGKNGRHIILKRNLRQEDKQTWLDLAKEYGRGETIRNGKIRYTGKLKLDCPVNNRYPGVDVVFEVIERTIDRSDQQLMIADIEVNTFWSTVREKAETVIKLYH